MKGINVGRWIVGGIAAGLLIWLFESAASLFYMDSMEAAMKAHSLSMEMSPGAVATSIAVSLLYGLVLTFIYAAARPRFGPGAKTALIAGVTMWFGGYLPSLVGFSMMGLFGTEMLVPWGIVGLVEMVLASLLGGWLYRE